MTLRTGVGEIELEVLHGQDPQNHRWGCPIRERWGLGAHERLSPGLQDKLAFTVTVAGTYAEASALADKWGVPISPSALHQLALRLGSRAEELTQRELQFPPVLREPDRPAAEMAVMMIDGWMVRQRGPGWGKKKTQENRTQWHEWKTGVFYRLDQSLRKKGRGVLIKKVVRGWQGDPVEFGRRFHWLAVSEGLGRARKSLIVGDGAPWIWNLAGQRWPQSEQLLDFFHATQHLWDLGRALHRDDEEATAKWVQTRRHQMRHNQEEQLLAEIARLKLPRGKNRPIVEREKNYFASHAHRMDYHRHHKLGHPIGSGSIESTCRQRQCRFKRPGQIWTPKGMQCLAALIEARENNHWDQLFLNN